MDGLADRQPCDLLTRRASCECRATPAFLVNGQLVKGHDGDYKYWNAKRWQKYLGGRVKAAADETCDEK